MSIFVCLSACLVILTRDSVKLQLQNVSIGRPFASKFTLIHQFRKDIKRAAKFAYNLCRSQFHFPSATSQKKKRILYTFLYEAGLIKTWAHKFCIVFFRLTCGWSDGQMHKCILCQLLWCAFPLVIVTRPLQDKDRTSENYTQIFFHH